VKNEPIECKKQIAYIPDNPDFYDYLTGIQYLNFIADVYGVSEEERTAQIGKYAEVFEITDWLGDLISAYSHGMRQKLVITGALIHQPKLWILDEPMVGLDPMSAKVFKDEMREHCNKGNTVFFSTHILEVAEKLCDRVGIINQGELIAVGTVDELKNKAKTGDSSLEDIFINIVNGESYGN
jgi:ABC-2 type transport system ATP-binding protein